MASLRIKYQNNTCRIECINALFPAFLLELEETFKNQFFSSRDSFEVYFSFPYILNSKQCIELYRLCDIYNVYVMEIEKNDLKKETHYVKEHLHNGEMYRFTQDCIYTGNIEKNVHIITSGNLYVIGRIKGIIDVLYPNCIISASSFEDARIRIFDSNFHNVTNYAPCKVYYELEQIKVV